MEAVRKPFQGVWNIVRFNWPFYVWALIFSFLILVIVNMTPEPYRIFGYLIGVGIVLVFSISLLVSWYVYDLSNLYDLNWAKDLSIRKGNRLVNIHAGFDEYSFLLEKKFPGTSLTVFDFYDPLKHTEASIQRARKAYPPFPGTLGINTTKVPLQKSEVDHIFVLLSAHEIREQEERICFFKELGRIVKPGGEIIVVEHLRDTANFLAYTIGFFHFHSKATWLKTFQRAELKIKQEKKITPFISIFIIQKNGTSL
jgi:SAM-dependent methyltransferase